MPNQSSSEIGFYALACLLGVGAGLLDVRVGDLLLTAVCVLASCMLLGVLRPERPWRWILLVAVFVPLAHLTAYLLFGIKPYRAQIYESFLGFLTGAAGAFGGSAGRRALEEIFGRK